MASTYLSVIIPSYNEMANLRKGVLDKIEHYLSSQKYSYEVIIVDDGSTDGSDGFVKTYARGAPSFRLLQSEHTGKAGAVTKGMLAAKGELRLFTDMDQATPIEEVEKFIPYIKQGVDIVIGSRKERKGSPAIRKFISSGAILLRKILVGMNDISDTQCGFKMFTSRSSEKLFKKVFDLNSGFRKVSGAAVTAGFDVELLFLAKKMGYRIKEVPVEWLYVESRRVSPVTDTINGVRDFIKIGLNKYRGKYNL